jgi:arylformamidase
VGDGKTIDQLAPDRLVGYAYVAEHTGDVTEDDIKAILARARAISDETARRILIKGKATLTLEAAKVLSREGVYLFGNESQTVGPEGSPRAVHLELLGADMILLEGARLGDVPEGDYLLFAAPISLGGAEGAPCRAMLVKL